MVNPKEIENLISDMDNILDSFCIAFHTKQGTLRIALFLHINKNKKENLIIKQVKTKIESLPNYKKPYMIKVIYKLDQSTKIRFGTDNCTKLPFCG